MKRIGKIILSKELGQGSFAKVYLGQHCETKEQFAVKKIDKL